MSLELEILRKENDLLRGLLAKGQGDCLYCSLPAHEIAKCASGFPGCGRMDDIMAAPIIKAEEDASRYRQALLRIKKKAGENQAVLAIVDGALDGFI